MLRSSVRLALIVALSAPMMAQQMNPGQIQGTAVVKKPINNQTTDSFYVAGYGANCNGAVDTTASFQAAANAARDAYLAHGGFQTVIAPDGNCVVSGQIRLYTGTILKGHGKMLVPNQTGHTIYAENTDNVVIDGVHIVVTTPGSDGPPDSAIAWYSVAAGSTAHKRFHVINSVVENSDWGILAYYFDGTGSLSDVDISGNTVTSNTVYTNADGIHVAGRVTAITIENNRVINRGDAAIALTSELNGSTLYVLSGAKVSNNVLLENRVGLDNSGATNAEWTGNYVRATTAAPGVSNPAFRSIAYPPNFTVNPYPTGVHAFNNYLYSGNNSGAEFTAKIDEVVPGQSAWPALNSTFEKNVIDGPNSPLYVSGRGVSVGDNAFITGGAMAVVYDGVAHLAAQDIILGSNKWMAAGSVNFGGDCALYSNVNLRPQATLAALTFSNLNCIGQQVFNVDNLTANTATIGTITSANLTSTSTNAVTIKPGTGSTNTLVVQDNPVTTNLMVLSTAGDINFPHGPLHWGGGVTLGSSSNVPQVGTGVANQAVCFVSVGPPNVLGHCTSGVSGSGACTCIP